jgi:hypothetical protein
LSLVTVTLNEAPERVKNLVVIYHAPSSTPPSFLNDGAFYPEASLKFDGTALVLTVADKKMLVRPKGAEHSAEGAEILEAEQVLAYRTNGERSHAIIKGDVFAARP